MKEIICFQLGSDRRPSACKADVITTTLQKPVTNERCHLQRCVNRELVVFRFLIRKTVWEYIKRLKIYPLLKMCNIYIVVVVVVVVFFKHPAILALRYQKVNHRVNHYNAKELTVNRQMSKHILAVKCLRYP